MELSFLFIALHIICVRSKPDAPTIPPTATSNKSLIARPAIAPATPDKLLSREMVIGISAPPTRIAKINPKKPATTAIAAISPPITPACCDSRRFSFTNTTKRTIPTIVSNKLPVVIA